MNLAALHDGKAFANYRHVAFVEIAKWRRSGLSEEAFSNQPSRVTSSLHRHLSHAGQRLAVLLNRGGIPDHKNLRMSGHREIGLHFDASRAIGFDSQPFARRRRSYSGGPDHGLAGDPLACHDDTVLIDLIHTMAQPHLDTQLLEVFPGCFRKAFGEGAEHAIGHVQENDASRERLNPPEYGVQR